MMFEKDTIAFTTGESRWPGAAPGDFHHRFAVLTWFDDDGSVPPWYLVRAVFPSLSQTIDAPDIVCEYRHDPETGFFRWKKGCKKITERPWTELARVPDKQLQEEEAFPSRFRFGNGSETVLVAEAERWDLTGGPPPYCDSCTLSFYSRVDISEVLKSIFTQACKKLDVCITGTDLPGGGL